MYSYYCVVYASVLTTTGYLQLDFHCCHKSEFLHLSFQREGLFHQVTTTNENKAMKIHVERYTLHITLSINMYHISSLL